MEEESPGRGSTAPGSPWIPAAYIDKEGAPSEAGSGEDRAMTAVRHSVTAALLAMTAVRHSVTAAPLAMTAVRHSVTAALLAVTACRHSVTAALLAVTA